MNRNHHQPSDSERQAAKAVRQFGLIIRSLGLANHDWTTSEGERKFIHDIGVMIERKDITGMTLEIVDPNVTVQYEHHVSFAGDGKPTGRRRDPARGTEISVIPPHLVAGYRITMSKVRPTPPDLLQLSWVDANPWARAKGASIDSPHTAKITGGRSTGKIYVSDKARHQGTLQRWGRRRFGFIKDDRLGKVYVHENDCQPGLEFRHGMRLDYLVVQTPPGLKACDVRPANSSLRR